MKSPARRRPVLQQIPYTIPDNTSSLRQLIEAIVLQEVEAYNSRELENMLIPFLTAEEIVDQSVADKVDFGRQYSDKKADPDKALQTAIQDFDDRLFRVLAGEEEITSMDAPLNLSEDDTLTFIRLTFLAGRLW